MFEVQNSVDEVKYGMIVVKTRISSLEEWVQEYYLKVQTKNMKREKIWTDVRSGEQISEI